MAKGYWVAGVDVTDPQKYATYKDFVGPYVASRGGTFLTRAGKVLVKEGTSRARTVVIEFPSFADALAAYEDDAYTEGRKLRHGAGELDLVIVEGE
ncbi:MAG: DUF1330 domain-containing protein [Devosia sp.]